MLGGGDTGCCHASLDTFCFLKDLLVVSTEWRNGSLYWVAVMELKLS